MSRQRRKRGGPSNTRPTTTVRFVRSSLRMGGERSLVIEIIETPNVRKKERAGSLGSQAFGARLKLWRKQSQSFMRKRSQIWRKEKPGRNNTIAFRSAWTVSRRSWRNSKNLSCDFCPFFCTNDTIRNLLIKYSRDEISNFFCQLAVLNFVRFFTARLQSIVESFHLISVG